MLVGFLSSRLSGGGGARKQVVSELKGNLRPFPGASKRLLKMP